MSKWQKWISKAGYTVGEAQLVDIHRGAEIYRMTPLEKGAQPWFEVDVADLAGNSYTSVAQAKADMDAKHPPEVEDAANELPEFCFTVNKTKGDMVVLVKRGVTGYWPAYDGIYSGQNWADHFNERIGVSRQQEAAMQAGSIFGFHIPGADPAMYDESGNLKRGNAQ